MRQVILGHLNRKNCLAGKACVGNSTESKACGDLKLGEMDVSSM